MLKINDQSVLLPLTFYPKKSSIKSMISRITLKVQRRPKKILHMFGLDDFLSFHRSGWKMVAANGGFPNQPPKQHNYSAQTSNWTRGYHIQLIQQPSNTDLHLHIGEKNNCERYAFERSMRKCFSEFWLVNVFVASIYFSSMC